MYLQQFPDLDWLKAEAASQFENKKDWTGRTLPHIGWPNVILNVKTQNIYRDNITGPVSLFGNISGESTVSVEGRRVVIPEGYFFVTNNKQAYTLEVGKQPAETFNVHFGNHFVSQVVHSLVSNDFDSGDIESGNNFRNRLIPISPQAKGVIQKVRSHNNAMHEEENLFELFSFLVDLEGNLKQQSMSVDALKKSTRDEIIRRLLISVDRIYSTSNQKLTLDDLSKESCLSKFHFLRLFRSAFKQTPYQFITEVRVGRAKELLTSTKLSVREIANQTGFDSSSTFSRTFFNTTGRYPTQFQRT